MNYSFRYAKPNDVKAVIKLFYHAFKPKFLTMLPNEPQEGLLLYFNYFYKGLNKKKDKLIICLDNTETIVGFLLIEGFGIPFFSLNPSPSIVKSYVRKFGIKKFFRLFLGMLLIEGYPPSTNYLYINTIIVKKEYRGQKIGKKFLKIAEYIAITRNMIGICLYVDSRNEIAMNMYKKQNFIIDGGFGGKFLEKNIGVKYYYYQYKKFTKK